MPEDLPLVTRVTDAYDAAQETAQRLRDGGARVVIVEEPVEREGSAFCSDHPAQLAARRCATCHEPICSGCMASAGGEPRCRPCDTVRHQTASRIRRRQLFLLFIFAAFLYKVYDHYRIEAERMDSSAPITIGIIQFAPKADTHANIIRDLNYPPSSTSHDRTLRTLAPWLNDEFKRYTSSTDDRFRVDIRGPFAVDVDPPPLSVPGDSWFTKIVRSFRYPRYFRQLALDHGLHVDEYTVRVYVVYGGTDFDIASHSRGSETGRVAVVFISLDELNPGYPLATIAHEVGHTLGATDKYAFDTSRATHPEGYVEPFAKPLYPQSFAELMAVDIPLSKTMEREVQDLTQVRVGHRTAAEMGWISTEQADLFYTPAEVRPEDRLSNDEIQHGSTDPPTDARD